MTGRILPVFLGFALSVAAGVAVAQTFAIKPASPTPAKMAPIAIEEPRDVVETLYKLAIAELKKAKGTSPFYNRQVRATYFSKGFDLLITSAETRAAHAGDAILDFDPISASQDAEMQKATLKTDVLESEKAVVSAAFLNHKQPTVVTYDFVREGGDWRVNDIKGTTEKEAWSVRKILNASGKQPTALPGMTDAKAAPDATIPLPPKKDSSAK